jgi:maltose-binding protein MalE
MSADKYVTDIICNGTGGPVCQWALQGKLLALDNLLPADFLAKINPNVLENSKYKGKVYALECWPSWVIMFYNKELYQKAGLDPATEIITKGVSKPKLSDKAQKAVKDAGFKDMGALAENLVFLKIKDRGNVCYRHEHGKEVDFIVGKTAIEVKFKDLVEPGELAGLSAMPNAEKLLVARKAGRTSGIPAVSLCDFLMSAHG